MYRLPVIAFLLFITLLMSCLSDIAYSSVRLEIRYGVFGVIINGEPIDFSQSKYQSKSDLISFEDGGGFTIHIYDPNASLGDLIRSTGMNFKDGRFVEENIRNYCDIDEARLKVFINGDELESPQDIMDFIPNDCDIILLTYGVEKFDEVDNQLEYLDRHKPAGCDDNISNS
jgi:hypothetical protein